MLTISIVIPVYSGEKYVATLCEEIEKQARKLQATSDTIRISEGVFVVDNAIDNSLSVLKSLEDRYDWLRIVTLSRNYGQHAATIAGILETTSDWVVTMDEDMQHPPAGIMPMLKKAAETGADVVYAKPTEAVHKSVFRDLPSKLVKSVLEKLTDNKNLRKANSFRLIRGEIARGTSKACGHETYFDVALSWFTTRFEGINMELRDQRFIETGKSGYSFSSLVSHARRMLVSSELKVLRIGTLFATMIAGVSVLWGASLLIRKFLFPESLEVVGWPSLMFAILFFGSVTLLLIGFMLEYISLLVQRAHGRPLYFKVDRSSDEILRAYLESNPSSFEMETAQPAPATA